MGAGSALTRQDVRTAERRAGEIRNNNKKQHLLCWGGVPLRNIGLAGHCATRGTSQCCWVEALLGQALTNGDNLAVRG